LARTAKNSVEHNNVFHQTDTNLSDDPNISLAVSSLRRRMKQISERLREYLDLKQLLKIQSPTTLKSDQRNPPPIMKKRRKTPPILSCSLHRNKTCQVANWVY
jgi:hypothetical protein